MRLNRGTAFSRVPVVHQRTPTECGPACLAMVLGAYGHHVEVRELGEELGAGRDGTSALTLVRAARRRGLEARAFSLPPEGLAHAPLPAIAHWKGDHYVVVERHGRGGVTIVDPETGRRRVTTAELALDYSGVLLVFTPGPGFRRTARPGGAAGGGGPPLSPSRATAGCSRCWWRSASSCRRSASPSRR